MWSKMWKAISAKRTGWGWLVAAVSVLLYLSDKWDSLNSIYEKVKKMGPLFTFVVDAARAPLVQLSVFVVGVLWIGLAAFFSAKRGQLGAEGKKGELDPTRAPQPVIVAIDELKSLLYEGERLVGRFQEDSVKPTFPEVEDWRKRTRDCARQNVLATESLVGAKDLLKLEKPWDEGELLRIAAKFVDYGCLRADDSVGLAVFKHLWGSVQRLRQLITKIEGEEPNEEKGNVDVALEVALQIVDGLIGARITNRSDSEVRVEDLWIASLDATGKKTEAKKIRKHKFTRCHGMPHLMLAHSSFEATFVCSEGAFQSYGQSHPHQAQTEYWIEVKLEDGTVVPSGHRSLITANQTLSGRKRSPTVSKLINDALRIIGEDKVQFTLYALQKAGVGDLDSEEEFLDAREAIIQRNLPDPIKGLSITEYGLTWLALIRFANRRELGLYNPVAVYDCVQKYLAESTPMPTAESRPRTISFDQESQIIKLLNGVALRPIWITTRMGSDQDDQEAHDYAIQLTRAFMKAGVPIEGRASVDVGTLFPNGVSIFWKKTIYNDVTASSIIEAVRITGVDCKKADRQVCVTHGKEPEINLMIGSNEIKPPS